MENETKHTHTSQEKMKTGNLKLLFYLFLLSLAACHPSGSKMKELKMANSMMEEHPDTALYILQRIPEPTKMHNEEYATYCLLRTQAEDMNGVTHTSDKMISVALEYFKDQDNPLLKAKAYYYYARVKEDLGQETAAEENYLKALSVLESTHEYIQTGIVYSKLSDFYLRSERYEEALDVQKKAYNNFLLANNQKSSSYYITVALSILVILSLLIVIFRYRLRFNKQEKQVGKQERQINAAKQTIVEQKAELADLRKEIKVMKKSLYNNSEIVRKLHAINDKPISPKEKPSLSETEWVSYLNVLEESCGFITHLRQAYPRLTDTDIRICALLKEGMTTINISSIMNMTMDALAKRIQRIKNDKMNSGGQNASLEVLLRAV